MLRATPGCRRIRRAPKSRGLEYGRPTSRARVVYQCRPCPILLDRLRRAPTRRPGRHAWPRAVKSTQLQEEELSANLQALYEALWAPIEQALPSQTKRVIISPDGQLNFISFATLLTNGKQFLAQTYDVKYVACGRDLLRELKPSTAKDVVLFANPDFGLASTAMLAKADHHSPDGSFIRGSEKREIEDPTCQFNVLLLVPRFPGRRIVKPLGMQSIEAEAEFNEV
jgi:hypothetical protein